MQTEALETTGQTKTITLPDGRPAVIRKLNWGQMKAAAKAASSENVAFLRELGGELLSALRAKGNSEAEADADTVVARVERLQKAQTRKPAHYEMATTLHDGVVSIGGKEQPDVIGLDPVTAECLHEAVVAYAWEVPGKNA